MVQTLDIRFPDGKVVFLGRLPRSRMNVLNTLLTELRQRWEAFGFFTYLLVRDSSSWDLMQTIIQLFPRFDRPGEWGFDLQPIREDAQQLERLFLADVLDNQYRPPLLIALHSFIPMPVPKWRQDDAEDQGVDSTGDPDVDLLASLTVGLESAKDAFFIFNTLDAEQIDKYLHQINELRRNPEDRAEEKLADDYVAWKNEHEDEYREYLGLQFQFPTGVEDGPQAGLSGS